MLTRCFGMGPWRVFDWPPAGRTDMNRMYRGAPGDFTGRMAFTQLGPVELELIQPGAESSIWADFLAEHGPGLHHLRFNVPDVNEVIAEMAGHGIGVTQAANGIRPGTCWANLDTEGLLGFTMEIMQPVPGTDGLTPSPEELADGGGE